MASGCWDPTTGFLSPQGAHSTLKATPVHVERSSWALGPRAERRSLHHHHHHQHQHHPWIPSAPFLTGRLFPRRVARTRRPSNFQAQPEASGGYRGVRARGSAAPPERSHSSAPVSGRLWPPAPPAWAPAMALLALPLAFLAVSFVVPQGESAAGPRDCAPRAGAVAAFCAAEEPRGEAAVRPERRSLASPVAGLGWLMGSFRTLVTTRAYVVGFINLFLWGQSCHP